ncbi:MAG: sigma-70 region 4 domain-containing protein [Candidatus Methanomethylophilaceae archaeon]|nr:sigma-70 region 4 domain-containing protein [Candidatus Methanomethylophilaceae archaeon]
MNEYVRKVFRPGAVVVSHGTRGGGKTHCAVSFCQAMMERRFPGMPEHVVLVTNVVFVRRREDGGFDTEAPPGVHTVSTMREIFPIAADALEEHGRKGTMIILLLDEAQNFLLGDMNGDGGLAKSMKSFCGIIRKFNMMLWLISPAMRNLGPAFRNFIDADSDPANVTCATWKDNARAAKYFASRGMREDPRSISYFKAGCGDYERMMPVPEASWTRDPEALAPGEYAYDSLSSADFRLGDGFPFGDLVFAISGRSSYEMVPAIRSFYEGLGRAQEAADVPEGYRERVEREYRDAVVWRMYSSGFTHKQIGAAFGVTDRTSKSWVARMKSEGRAGSPADGLGAAGDASDDQDAEAGGVPTRPSSWRSGCAKGRCCIGQSTFDGRLHASRIG